MCEEHSTTERNEGLPSGNAREITPLEGAEQRISFVYGNQPEGSRQTLKNIREFVESIKKNL